MKIILCIGIIIIAIILWQINRNTYSAAWGIGYLYRLLATGEPVNANLIVLEEIKNCTLLVQIFFNCKEELSITDFSLFNENNRFVGLQIFDTRQEEIDTMEPQIFHNVTLRKVIEEGQKEKDAVWLWYLPEGGIE